MNNTTRGAGDTLAAFGTEIVEEASQIKAKVLEVAQESLNSARNSVERAGKRGCAITEDLLDDATRQVKRHPLQSVGVTLGIGLAAGLAIGWFAAPKSH